MCGREPAVNSAMGTHRRRESDGTVEPTLVISITDTDTRNPVEIQKSSEL